MLVGRDTRASGRELERAFASGVASAGGHAVLAGVLPTPAVALLSLDLGAVISASHNPPQYNGVKLFDGDGGKLTDAAEEEIEALLDAPPSAEEQGGIDNLQVVGSSYVRHVVERFGGDLAGLKVAVDCANGAYSAIAPQAFEGLGAEVVAIGDKPDGYEHQRRLRRHRPARAPGGRRRRGVRPGGGVRRRRRSDAGGGRARRGGGRRRDLAVLALDLGVDLVAVTQMANLGFHRLMAEARHPRRHHRRRRPLRARGVEARGGLLGGEQSGHIIYLKDHVTGDGLAAALLLCRALDGRKLSQATAVLERYPQARANVPVARKELTEPLLTEVERLNAELAPDGRVLVRPSGTEPVVRVLAEAPAQEKADSLCASIAALVASELG